MNSQDDKSGKTKKQQVVDWLRDTIIAGDLAPGERLIQSDLAEKLDVSATPIREAIQLLVAEGVLVHNPYRGVQVADVKMEDVREVYLIRCELEELATRVAIPNLRLSEVKALHQRHEHMAACIQSGDLHALRRMNYDFHMTIYHAADMPLLHNIIRNLWTRFPWDTLHVIPDRARLSNEDHLRILEAIEAVDAEQAGRIMRQHVENGMLALDQYLQNYD